MPRTNDANCRTNSSLIRVGPNFEAARKFAPVLRRAGTAVQSGSPPGFEGIRPGRMSFDDVAEIVTIERRKMETVRKETVMTIELPEDLGAVLKAQANAHGVSADGYARELLQRDLGASLEEKPSGIPFKTGRGMFAKYGQAPSAEEIDANRADMFRNFGEDF
jgi:plasmid stability protein